MKKHSQPLIHAALFFLLSYSVQAQALQCRSLFDSLKSPLPIQKVVEKAAVTDKKFIQTTNALRSTLAGKLATVWRSEWKTKLTVNDSNEYVYDLAKNFLTTSTSQKVLEGLDPLADGFTREVHARLFALQKKGELKAGDDIMVRDEPAAEGVWSNTFTYYTKPIVNPSTPGKHQLRLRTYVNEITYHEMKIDQTVTSYNLIGLKIDIKRVNENSFEVTRSQNEKLIAQDHLNLNEMIAQFGEKALLLAPHGKNFKMEVKTALDDQITATKYPLLQGKHMVQKLDVSLSMNQVETLFAPLKSTHEKMKIQESLARVDALTKELIAKKPETKARVEAVFNVVRDGIKGHADYLTIEGATTYNRTAFESKSGFQSTIDRDQGVYADHMYHDGQLRNPLQTVLHGQLKETGTTDARHVELKVPVTSMQNTVGIEFQDAKTAPKPENVENDSQIKNAVSVFYKYVKTTDHAGKFNYILKSDENID